MSSLGAAVKSSSSSSFQGTASQYHLTPEQVQFYDDNGYLILRNWVTGDLLKRLQEAGTAWIEDGLKATSGDAGAEDYLFAKRPAGRVFFRIDYLHNKVPTASLELLGSPQALGVAESLCGRNFVPTYESMVFKQAGDGAEVAWHQDAVHGRRWRVFNFDLYLDRAVKGQGALFVIPKSHTTKQDVCRVVADQGWGHGEAIEVTMEPGDVLLHDVMVLHGSPRSVGGPLRRTIYLEFRAAEMIVAEGPWDRAWIERRHRLIPVVLGHYQRAYPAAEQFAWNIEAGFRPAPLGSEAEELRVAHIHHTVGSFCSATSGGAAGEPATPMAPPR